MRVSGTAELPLHEGHAPAWLVERMKNLASAIVKVIVHEYSASEVVRRMGDPFWFQSLGCVLGFDWHSSGLTTVVAGVLREALSLDRHGVAVVGGKGNLARKVPEKLNEINIREEIREALAKASRITAKVDNALLQDGYTIYHHVIIFTEKGEWAVVQQGMNISSGYARRYHWVSEGLESFVVEPHSGIAGQRRENMVLDMTAKRSEEARRISVDLVKEPPEKLIRTINLIQSRQLTLTSHSEGINLVHPPKHLYMPRRIDWEAVKRAYEIQPRNYEELIQLKGLGPATVRALALVSSLIYGAEIEWRDPVKYSFAHGGKDGVPYPVERRRMDKVIGFLREAVEACEASRSERLEALRRLSRLEEMAKA